MNNTFHMVSFGCLSLIAATQACEPGLFIYEPLIDRSMHAIRSIYPNLGTVQVLDGVQYQQLLGSGMLEQQKGKVIDNGVSSLLGYMVVLALIIGNSSTSRRVSRNRLCFSWIRYQRTWS